MRENNINIHPRDDQAEEAEESLSLRHLPLDLDPNNNPPNDHLQKISTAQSRRSSSESAPEFFEFLGDLSYDMCPADDIIFCGKLIPLKEQHVSFQTRKDCRFEAKRKNHVLLKRSESLSEIRGNFMESIPRSDSTKNTTFLRNSRSWDHQKHHRYDLERNPSTRSVEKSKFSRKKAVKPRWYVFMFGMVKFRPEMELKDMKSRQFRRIPSVMFPTVDDGGKKFSGNWSSGQGSPWSLLKALSCRDHTSVAVTTPFWMPQT